MKEYKEFKSDQTGTKSAPAFIVIDDDLCLDDENVISAMPEPIKKQVLKINALVCKIIYFLDDNRAWNELFEAATQKSELLKQADEKLSEAKSSVSKAIDIIESGKKDSSINR